jgi:hypothetical protein
MNSSEAEGAAAAAAAAAAEAEEEEEEEAEEEQEEAEDHVVDERRKEDDVVVVAVSDGSDCWPVIPLRSIAPRGMGWRSAGRVRSCCGTRTRARESVCV